MIHEFSAGEFISALIEFKKETNKLMQHAEFDYIELNKRACQVMKKNPAIRICLDNYSIETFRRQNSRSIVIEQTKIRVVHLNSNWMRSVIKQNLPSKNYMKILAQYEAR